MTNRSVSPVSAELAQPAVRDRLLQVARSILREDPDAEDAVHDAVVQALRAADSFRAESQTSTWLHRVTVNAALMSVRKRKREHTRTPVSPGSDSEFDASAQLTSDEERGPAALLEARERNLRLHLAVAKLPPAYGEVLRLCVFDELPLPEAARALGISASAVRTRICRARGFLRERLAA
jgi:RNA polymerase sigma-70 factor (ECF subfamily)